MAEVKLTMVIGARNETQAAFVQAAGAAQQFKAGIEGAGEATYNIGQTIRTFGMALRMRGFSFITGQLKEFAEAASAAAIEIRKTGVVTLDVMEKIIAKIPVFGTQGYSVGMAIRRAAALWAPDVRGAPQVGGLLSRHPWLRAAQFAMTAGLPWSVIATEQEKIREEEEAAKARSAVKTAGSLQHIREQAADRIADMAFQARIASLPKEQHRRQTELWNLQKQNRDEQQQLKDAMWHGQVSDLRPELKALEIGRLDVQREELKKFAVRAALDLQLAWANEDRRAQGEEQEKTEKKYEQMQEQFARRRAELFGKLAGLVQEDRQAALAAELEQVREHYRLLALEALSGEERVALVKTQAIEEVMAKLHAIQPALRGGVHAPAWGRGEAGILATFEVGERARAAAERSRIIAGALSAVRGGEAPPTGGQAGQQITLLGEIRDILGRLADKLPARAATGSIGAIGEVGAFIVE